jgi:excisionase family DNA binding protein
MRRRKFGLWLTRGDAASYLGVSERTIYKWLANGMLDAVRVEGYNKTRIARKQLEELKAEAEQRGVSLVMQLALARHRDQDQVSA